MGRRRRIDAGNIMRMAQARIAIESVQPEIDAGRFAAAAIAGDPMEVSADIFSDGHDVIRAALMFRDVGKRNFQEYEMHFMGNDRWVGEFVPTTPGKAQYTIIAWRDVFATWQADIEKKIDAGQNVGLEIDEGLLLIKSAHQHAKPAHRQMLERYLRKALNADDQLEILRSAELLSLMSRAGIRENLTQYPRELDLTVERPLAAFSAWYEMFPRSQGGMDQHGTFDDVIERLHYVRDLGFDVLYFPPIHPIGLINRKGPNNNLTAGANDPGSPYAIGNSEGGHTGIHPELGSIEDFDRLVAAACDQGIEIALDFAIQCAPDHPWIKEHPEWFDWRPDGSIKYAENPPKKYQDIVNVHFYGDAIPDLWLALRDVVVFWIDRGVKIFRVDNPHTKPFPFWEWLISGIRASNPEVIFLSEAFTRPKVMKHLAKLGFTQSYSYFTWRNTKAELTDYLSELTTTDAKYVMRPNFFTNTPDINPYFLQTSGRSGYRTRLILAGTLAGNYGIYNGFEICEGTPIPGREEYLDSEKYQLRHWDFGRPGHIKDDIRFLNTLRKENPALRDFTNLRFYNAWNDQILYYGRMDERQESWLLFHVNIDPHNVQECHFEVPLWEFGLGDDASIEVEDMISKTRFTWNGKIQWLKLDPQTRPYAVWRLFAPTRNLT